MTPTEWRKSSFSTGNQSCVEVATGDEEILLRNSNRIADGTLAFSRSEMAALVSGIKSGDFDELI